MKLFNFVKITLATAALSFGLIALAVDNCGTVPNSAPYPNPAGGTPIFYGVYPVNLTVPYGADSANPNVVALTFDIVNQTSNTYTLSGFSLTPVNPPSSNPVTVTSYSTNCNNTLTPRPPAGQGVCQITANISAVNNQDQPITFNFKFNYSAGRPAATLQAPSFTVDFASGNEITAADRTVTFVNNCGYDVWFGIASGAAPAINPVKDLDPPDPNSCLVDTDCYPGSLCKEVGVNPVLKHCLWENPAPTGAGNPFHLLANNGSGPIDVVFKARDNGISAIWNGGLAGRLGCSDSAATPCKVADCTANPSGTACPLTKGFATPSTLVEFTFEGAIPLVTANSGQQAVDTYDVTIINGVTVPVSMVPKDVTWGGASKPYTCGNPGAVTTTAPLGACTWYTMLPPASGIAPAVQEDFVWVDVGGTGGSDNCTGTISSSSCTVSGNVCGHTVVGATVSAGLVCGERLGYLTPDAVCAIDSSFGSPFNCADTVTQSGKNYTLTELYGCSHGVYKNSCYTTGASSACCGCDNWDDATIPPTTATCNATNSHWIDKLITTNYLPWFKQVCPTAYIFPYDDASSTFTCGCLNSSDTSAQNVVDYTITFCPS